MSSSTPGGSKPTSNYGTLDKVLKFRISFLFSRGTFLYLLLVLSSMAGWIFLKNTYFWLIFWKGTHFSALLLIVMWIHYYQNFCLNIFLVFGFWFGWGLTIFDFACTSVCIFLAFCENAFLYFGFGDVHVFFWVSSNLEKVLNVFYFRNSRIPKPNKLRWLRPSLGISKS
jgi:hypothetical protein